MSVWTSRGGIVVANGSNGIASHGGITLLIDGAGAVFKSLDGGTTWAATGITIALGSQNGTLVVSGTGTWIWAGSADNPFTTYRSTDNGATWNPSVSILFGGNGGSLITDNAGHWALSAGAVGPGVHNIAYSADDGVTWTNQQVLSDATNGQCIWDGSQYVFGCGAIDTVLTSSGGTIWTLTSSAPASLFSVAFNPSGPHYVVSNSSTNSVRVATTAIGLASASNTSIAGLDAGGLGQAIFSAGQFVIFDFVGGVSSSIDNGATWTVGTLNFPVSDGCNNVTYDSVHGNFIAVSIGGYVSTLAVSSGATVPNVVGDNLHAAASVITTAGFLVGAVTIQSGINAVDTIISQNPVVGASEPLGTPVNVVVSTGPAVIINKLTKKLLLYLHRIFDKDPHQQLAFRIQYDGDDLAWSILNGVLTLTATGGTGASYTFNIANFVIGDLADFIAALPGYSVPYQDTSAYALLSALALLDQSNDINTSNGDHVYGYTTLLWAWMDSNSSELGTAKLQIGNALQQMNTNSAKDEWLDYHGTFYNVPRQQGELDPGYSPRMIASVLQPRGNNVAIAVAITSIAIGAQRVRVIDAIDDIGFAITYDGLIKYNGAEFFDAGLGVNGAYGFFDVDFSFDFAASVTQDTYFSQILTTVQAFRDAGTQLRAVIFRNNGSTTTIVSDSFVNGIRVIVYNDFTGETFRMLEDGTTRFEEDGTARILES